VALFPVIDPFGSGLIVNNFMNGISVEERKKYARSILINCFYVGFGSLIAGHLILMMFGLVVPVIQIAGGIIICKSGLEWLNGSDEENIEQDSAEAAGIKAKNLWSKIFYPISFPICLGPGTIAVIFTLMASADDSNWTITGLHYILIVLAIVLQLILLYFVILTGSKISKKLGAAGNLVINKLIAFITFCIGIQIFLSGIAKTFHLDIF
jgi:MarC family membrane protein